MTLARIFQSGNSQAVRLPKEFRFDVDEVEILRRGDEVILRPVHVSGAAVFEALAGLPQDLWPEGRQDEQPQPREPF
ncbi:MAG: antitoxin [Rubrivivax sp.]